MMSHVENESIYSNNGSNKLTNKIQGSNSFYHFSKTRESLLNWYDFYDNATLLEIGGEYGALTELFCKKCKKVVTLVKKQEESLMIEKRLSYENNLQVFTSNELDVDIIEGKFDYIVLPGTLECMGAGSRSMQPYKDVFQKLCKRLTKRGVILLAVDNRYGLRYFCGERDVVSGIPFYGLNRYRKSDKYTFSKRELETIVTSVPNMKYKFYYLLPDWRYTQIVYTDEQLPKKNLKERLQCYTNDISTLVIDELKLYDDICDNNVFPFFSNAYLIECSVEGDFDKAQYVTVSTDRGIHGFATKIMQDTVQKIALQQEGIKYLHELKNNIDELKRRNIAVVEHRMSFERLEMERVTFPTLSEVIKEAAQNGSQEIIYLFDLLYVAVLKSSEKSLTISNLLKDEEIGFNEWGPILQKVYIDMIPINCFYNGKELIFFDQEFVWNEFPAVYVMFRALKYTYWFMPFIEEIVAIDFLKNRYGLTDSIWKCFCKIENRFVSENRNYDIYSSFTESCKRPSKTIRINIDRLSGDNNEK